MVDGDMGVLVGKRIHCKPQQSTHWMRNVTQENWKCSEYKVHVHDLLNVSILIRSDTCI